MARKLERVPFTCSADCGSRCELVALVHDGEIVSIETPAQPDTEARPRLVPCARGRSQGRLRESPDRVLAPLIRTGPRGSGEFEEISWPEALDEVAASLEDVREAGGGQAILHAAGAGALSGRGFSGAMASKRFFSHWDSVTEISGNMSNHCTSMAAKWMLGRRIDDSDAATMLDARLIVLWGNNPAETHMGPNTAHFIASARDRDARVILIDPRYCDSAVLSDQWIPIRPGTDAALAAALAYVIETEDLADHAFLASHTVGYKAYQRYILGLDDNTPKNPTWAATITGIPEETIVGLARDLATLKPACLLPGWAPQRTLYGEQISRALVTLACQTGNVGLRGGGLASVGGRSNRIPIKSIPYGPHKPGRTLSPALWAQDILNDTLEPKPGLIYIVGSNLVNRSPNTLDNLRALERIEHIIVQDPFMTPTARYADLVLPVCTDLERSDLITSWGHDSHLFFSQQAVDPLGIAHTDYWIFAQLAERLGFRDALTQGRDEQDWLAHLMAQSEVDRQALQSDGIMRTDPPPRVALAEFRENPEQHPLGTASGLIEITNPAAEAYGLPAIPSYIEATPDNPKGYPLQLITPHHKLRANSGGFSNPWLQRLDPHEAWINAHDAHAHGISQGDLVTISSPSGRIRIRAKVTERIMPGVVCVYQGTWFRAASDGTDVGGCANVLTGHKTSPTGGFATHTEWVSIERYQA